MTTLASSVTPWPHCAWTLELVLCRVVICFWLLESGMVKFCPSLLETGEPWPIITSWRCCSCTESRSSVSLCDAPSFEGIVAPTSRIFLAFFWSFILGQSWHLCPRQSLFSRVAMAGTDFLFVLPLVDGVASLCTWSSNQNYCSFIADFCECIECIVLFRKSCWVKLAVTLIVPWTKERTTFDMWDKQLNFLSADRLAQLAAIRESRFRFPMFCLA